MDFVGGTSGLDIEKIGNSFGTGRNIFMMKCTFGKCSKENFVFCPIHSYFLYHDLSTYIIFGCRDFNDVSARTFLTPNFCLNAFSLSTFMKIFRAFYITYGIFNLFLSSLNVLALCCSWRWYYTLRLCRMSLLIGAVSLKSTWRLLFLECLHRRTKRGIQVKLGSVLYLTIQPGYRKFWKILQNYFQKFVKQVNQYISVQSKDKCKLCMYIAEKLKGGCENSTAASCDMIS